MKNNDSSLAWHCYCKLLYAAVSFASTRLFGSFVRCISTPIVTDVLPEDKTPKRRQRYCLRREKNRMKDIYWYGRVLERQSRCPLVTTPYCQDINHHCDEARQISALASPSSNRLPLFIFFCVCVHVYSWNDSDWSGMSHCELKWLNYDSDQQRQSFLTDQTTEQTHQPIKAWLIAAISISYWNKLLHLS